MPPRIPAGEDTQPNERRFSRKGATNVPIVRLTTPRRTERGGRAQSYRSGATYANRTQNFSHAAAMSNRSQFPSRGRVNPAHYSTARRNSGDPSHHPAASYPPTANSVSQNTPKRLSTFPDARQWKRPRLETPSQSRVELPATPSLATKSNKKKSSKSRIEIRLDTPLYCRTGVFGYRASRRGWVDREIQRIEQEQKVKVLSTQYLDREVLFYCSAEEAQGAADFSAKGEEQVPRIDTADVDQGILEDRSKDEDVQVGINAVSAMTVGFKNNGLVQPTQHYGSLMDRNGHSQQKKSLPKPIISTDSNRFVTLQQRISIDEPSGSRPLSKNLRSGCPSPQSNFTNHTANSDQVQLAPPDNNPSCLLDPLLAAHVPASKTLTRSIRQHVNLPHRAPHAFRSGTLTIRTATLMGPLSTPNTATKRNCDNLASAKEPTTPLPLYSDKADSRTTWTDDSDSDTSLAPTIGSRAIHHPIRGASPKRTDHNLEFTSSNRTLSLDQSPSSADAQSGPKFKIETMRMSLDRHDRSRRILRLSPSTLIHATMHGFINRVELSPLKQHSVVRAPVLPARELVDDACLLQAFDQTFAILGHGRDEQQISLVSLDFNKEHALRSLDRPWNRAKKGGVSAVSAMMQPLTFASGGYDHGVHLWTAEEDFSSASPSQLAIKHTSVVQSLLPIRDTSHKLVSAGADTNVQVWDLSSERVVNTIRASNSVFHAHPTSSPYCILLEVAHRELQYELRDYRLVPETPVQRFGYETSQIHGRFIKGDLRSNEFVCGSRDGCIRLWDVRSFKVPFVTLPCFPPAKIVQAVFDQSSGYVLACSATNDIARIRYATNDL